MPKRLLIFTTFLTLVFYNLSRIIGSKVFAKTVWWQGMVSDNWHHYQLGFLLIIISFLMLRKKKTMKDLLLAIGTGMVIDESMFVVGIKHYTITSVFFEMIVFIIYSLLIIKYRR